MCDWLLIWAVLKIRRLLLKYRLILLPVLKISDEPLGESNTERWVKISAGIWKDYTLYISIVKSKNVTPGVKILEFKSDRKNQDFPKSENSNESHKLKVNCKGFTSWCHMKELSNCWRTICVSLKSAKPFSSYEALKTGRGILIEVGKCRFPTFRTPHYCRKWRHRRTVILCEKLLVLISTLFL